MIILQLIHLRQVAVVNEKHAGRGAERNGKTKQENENQRPQIPLELRPHGGNYSLRPAGNCEIAIHNSTQQPVRTDCLAASNMSWLLSPSRKEGSGEGEPVSMASIMRFNSTRNGARRGGSSGARRYFSGISIGPLVPSARRPPRSSVPRMFGIINCP